MPTIHNYQVTDERLGSGGMGLVYKAYRRFDGIDRQDPAACKVIRPELSGDSHWEEMFLREAFVAMRLTHPNIVPVYDCMRVSNRLYLMMEYIDGCSLEDLVAHHGPLPESVVAHVVHSVAQALAYLHAEGILHRDIAPSNILISTCGRVKVSDLGLARADDDGYSARGFTGRVAFACPGRVHTGQHTQHSDLWALLATAFYAASGYLPYGPDTHGADRTQAGFDEVFERFTSLEIAKPDCEFSVAFNELLADLEILSAAGRRFQSAADIAAFIAAHFPVGLDSEETGRMVAMTRDPVKADGQPAKRTPAPRRRRLPDTVTDAIAPGMVSGHRNTALGRFLVLLLVSVSLALCVESAVVNPGSGKQFTHRTTPPADWRLGATNACYLESEDTPKKQGNRTVSSNSTSYPTKNQEPTRAAKRPVSTRTTRHKQRAKRRQKSPSHAVVLRGRSIPLHVDKGVSP
ncbi:MAG: serine/threonine protein kinase [Proteobacteria bacterium]|nr:serine/threonine protein kinase [Pseudomonadota bacterium]